MADSLKSPSSQLGQNTNAASESTSLPEVPAQPTMGAARPAELPTRTSMFRAINALRYTRQELIRKIDEETGRHLICYISGRLASIDRDDIVFMVDLLERIPQGGDVDLLLHTPGGDMDAAEKIVAMIRARVSTGQFRVIVPDFAKSSGTLIAIGADKVLMSDSSELGPIDPQLVLSDGRGNLIAHSVQAFLDAYEEHSKILQNNPNHAASRMMLDKLDPGTMKLFAAAKERARNLAQKHLLQGMLKGGSVGNVNYTMVASNLLDTQRWLAHGQMIGPYDAKEIGLEVEQLSPTDSLWHKYWDLYCLQRLAVTDRQKLFESHYVSLPVDH